MMEALLSKTVLFDLFLFSVASFVGTLIIVPLLLVRLPADYFREGNPRVWMPNHHPVLRGIGIAVKNLVGAIFLLAGIAMLVLPGQGILTMLIGVSLMNFPGKRRLEKRLISQPAILQTINHLRQKFGQPPLIIKGASLAPLASSRMAKDSTDGKDAT